MNHAVVGIFMSGFIACLALQRCDHLLFPVFCAPKTFGASFNLTIQVSAWSSLSIFNSFLPGFTTRSAQLSHFSDSLAVTSDFAVTFGLVEHVHAESSSLSWYQASFRACTPPCLLPHSCVRRCGRTWMVRPSTWTVQVPAWSLPVHLRLFWVHHGRERPAQFSHFSNFFVVTSGFAVTSDFTSASMAVSSFLCLMV